MRHDLPEENWKKSSYSGAQSGDCLEVQITHDGRVAARDSKTPSMGAFVFSPEGWSAFVEDVKRGHFD
ncbi:DUF397 domain-containing protein [Streptomyces kronopolitis]|uniref:DUF397 domain-containing protein n=1 Tax=Streptomyces kronopolitis TaxID=1612435 RepID=UPI003D97262D